VGGVVRPSAGRPYPGVILVVSNTSPISNLAIIGRLDLLRERYGRVLIPPAVKTELDALAHAAGKRRIEQALCDDCLPSTRQDCHR